MALSAPIRHDIGYLSTLPLGSVIGWHRDLDPQRPAVLPPGWVEANGQVLNDPESPYHGHVIPNLNGDGRFLRGGATSGVIQADQLQSHTHQDQGHFHSRNTQNRPERVLHTDSDAGAGHATVGANNSNPVGTDTGTARAVLGGPTALNQGAVRHGAETRPVNMSVVWILKVKQVTAARAVAAVGAHEGAPLGAVYIGADGRVGVGTSTPQATLDVQGDLRLGAGATIREFSTDGTFAGNRADAVPTERAVRSFVAGQIGGVGSAEGWSAERTGFVVVQGVEKDWAEIPGLAITFDLVRDALVQLTANGTQRAAGGTIHVAYRFVVDGAGRGDQVHGQRLLVNNVSADWWNIWTLAGFERLAAGRHSIAVEVRNSGGDNGVGVVCGETGPTFQEYTGGVLNLLAIYQAQLDI